MTLAPERAQSQQGGVIPSYGAETSQQRRELVGSYSYEDAGLRVEVVRFGDPLVGRAIDIEVAGMAKLGDPEEEVREEFEPYSDASLFFLAFEDGKPSTPENIVGMGRIVETTAKTGAKTLNDLASIDTWATHRDKDEATIAGLIELAQDDVVEKFMTESGCKDLEKVWDIATLSLDLQREKRTQLLAADSIITSFTRQGVASYRRGELTHITSFNEVHAHGFFLRLGYPLQKLFGREPMKYDSFGSDEGMTAQPAWMSMEDLIGTINSGHMPHMKKLRALLEIDSVEIAPPPVTIEPTPELNTRELAATSYLDRIKALLGAGAEDYKGASTLQKLGLFATAAFLAYEWGPGNETVTPLIAAQVLNRTEGTWGAVATAAIAGGVTYSEQRVSGELAAYAGSAFPKTADKALGLFDAGEKDDAKHKSWGDLPRKTRFGYAFFLGSTFAAVREAVVTGGTDYRNLRKAAHSSALTAGATVAVTGGAAGILKDVSAGTPLESTSEFVVNTAANPLTWLGLLGASALVNRIKRKHAT